MSDTVGLSDPDGVGVALLEGEVDGVGPEEGLAAGVALGLRPREMLADGVPELDGVTDGVPVRVPVCVGVRVCVPVCVGVPVRVPVLLGVLVPVLVCVAVELRGTSAPAPAPGRPIGRPGRGRRACRALAPGRGAAAVPRRVRRPH